MAVDTPARIAVIGAGAVGIEAALYGRYLGYEVRLLESRQVGAFLSGRDHLRLFTPWRECTTPLGWAALEAQNAELRFPAPDEAPTARQWLDRYLIPLAESDLLCDSLETGTTIRSVGRARLAKGWWAEGERRAEQPLRLLLESAGGVESYAEAEIVIDATGRGLSAPLGDGGMPALGQRELGEELPNVCPDFSGPAGADYAGRHVLVVGSGLSAATNVVALVRLAQRNPGTRVTWVTRRRQAGAALGPVREWPDDPLVDRQQLAAEANRMAAEGGLVTHRSGTTVEAVRPMPGGAGFSITLVGDHAGTLEVDRVLANVGFQATPLDVSSLHLALCPFTGAWVPAPKAQVPRELGEVDPRVPPDPAASPDPAAGDAQAWNNDETEADEEIPDPLGLIQPEPNFYVIGAKSRAGNWRYTVGEGLRQVRALFAIIGDRPDLDLYAAGRYGRPRG